MKYRYPFTHEITFALVMQDPIICRGLLQLIFPNRRISEIQLQEPRIDVEKMLIAGIEPRKVRLDVLFEDSDEWYDIEMQSRDNRDIPKRCRYAHGIMDVNQLKAGQDYNELKASYVIFLCRFDPFEKGEAVYSFSMADVEKNLPLGDESFTIILNSRAEDDRVPESLKALFKYMNEAVVSGNSELLQQIDESVQSWNTGEGVNLIMTLEQEILIKEARARKEGYSEGLSKGLNRALYVLLKKDGRDGEYEEALKNASKKEELLKEYGLLEL